MPLGDSEKCLELQLLIRGTLFYVFVTCYICTYTMYEGIVKKYDGYDGKVALLLLGGGDDLLYTKKSCYI